MLLLLLLFMRETIIVFMTNCIHENLLFVIHIYNALIISFSHIRFNLSYLFHLPLASMYNTIY